MAAYTELEWSIGVQAPAAVDDVYEFRVFYDDADTALDSYAVTPQLTVATAAGPAETMYLYVTRSTLVS